MLNTYKEETCMADYGTLGRFLEGCKFQKNCENWELLVVIIRAFSSYYM